MPFVLVAASLLAGGSDSSDDDAVITVGALVASSIFLWIFLVGVPTVATTRKGNGLVRDLGLRFRPVDAGAFVVGAALQAVVVPALYWPILELWDRNSDDVSSEARRLIDGASGAGIAVLVLVVCVGAPFAEELFYRGLALRATEKRFGTGVAVVATTVLFGVAHFQGLQLPALLLFGAVATVLTVRTGRLGPAMLCHAGFNAWSLFQLLVIDPS
ncbi:MAG: CPBP family intramembrane metalloprotease [Acidimicrobiia bacterium]|nr:CPBP family intramembrane metalloprotease [Acidimicrobiia bacterium]